MKRTAYLAAFAVFALAAGLLTLRSQHTVAVLVATRDVRAGTAIQGADVEVRRVHDDGAPAGSLTAADQAVGRFAAWPLTAGEPVLARQVRSQRSGGSLAGGLDIPSGYRAVAVPVQAASAVGGVLAPGDRVDVFATPQPGHAGTHVAGGATGIGAPEAAAAAERQAAPLGRDVLVLELRSDQGQALGVRSGDGVHGLDFGNGKLGSVVLAVPAADVAAYAAAASTDTIYLALSVG